MINSRSACTVGGLLIASAAALTLLGCGHKSPPPLVSGPPGAGVAPGAVPAPGGPPGGGPTVGQMKGGGKAGGPPL